MAQLNYNGGTKIKARDSELPIQNTMTAEDANAIPVAVNDNDERITVLENKPPGIVTDEDVIVNISENQYGTHPAFSNQNELNIWLLGGEEPPTNPIITEFTATPVSPTQIDLSWQ